VALFAVAASAAFAWNRCGPAAHNAAQWKHNAQRNGTWKHVIGIVRSNPNTYHFHPVDNDTVNSWFDRQAIILLTAHRGTIPNTGCEGMRVGKLHDKTVGASWPILVALPDGLTTKDVRPHKIGSFIHRILIKGAFLGQASCINGTSRPDVEEVVGYVQEQKVPASKPAPKPPTPSINCSGDTVNLGQTGNAQGGNCSTNTVIVEEQPPCSSCQSKPVVVTPPPSHYTNVSCVGFEEVSGGGSFLVDCDVSNDNGAVITLDAHSNDTNTRVSGTNCYSQGGTPSCHGSGTFEFRVSGINDGSSIVYSSVTVVASSNGVDKKLRSDPFPVDPSSGGF
jgi:hypothetical protein